MFELWIDEGVFLISRLCRPWSVIIPFTIIPLLHFPMKYRICDILNSLFYTKHVCIVSTSFCTNQLSGYNIMTKDLLINSPTSQLLIFPPAIYFFFLSLCKKSMTVMKMQSITGIDDCDKLTEE